MNVINLLDEQGFRPYAFGERFRGMDKEIANFFGSQELGFHLEVLNPKCFSSPYHFHEKEEELVIVLQGEAILRQNNRFRKIARHDLIFFPTGHEYVHQIYNHSEEAFKYFVLSNKSEKDVCHYPDSRKTLNKQNRIVTQDGNEVDYWKDEHDPSSHWPPDVLSGLREF